MLHSLEQAHVGEGQSCASRDPRAAVDEDLLLLLVDHLVHDLSNPEKVEAVVLLDEVIERHPNGPYAPLGAEAGELRSLDSEPVGFFLAEQTKDLLDASRVKVVDIALAAWVGANVDAHVVDLLVGEPAP